MVETIRAEFREPAGGAPAQCRYWQRLTLAVQQLPMVAISDSSSHRTNAAGHRAGCPEPDLEQLVTHSSGSEAQAQREALPSKHRD